MKSSGPAISEQHGRSSIARHLCSSFIAVAMSFAAASAQTANSTPVRVDWVRSAPRLKTSPTLQVVVNPMLERGSPIHDAAFRSLQEAGADDVRYVPWFPYPQLAVAELLPPTSSGTSWNFSLIDPMTEDFFAATQGHSVILNFSTIPAWMFITKTPVTYPSNPNTVDWNYNQGNHLRDPTMRELGNYYARLVGWYTRGGFTDELGRKHRSGHHYKIDYWEVFNEVDFEHQMTPQQYTRRYDAVVSAIHKVDPQIKFVGLALASPGSNPEMFSYFLDHSHHRPGIPLDMISYHFYATPTRTQTINEWQYTFFDQADRFLTAVRYVEAIRKRLSPETRTTLDEIGSILPTDNKPDDATVKIPSAYWNLSGALYAYVFMKIAKLGIDLAGESQLVGYPSQFPSVSMVDWTTGRPNARLRVLDLLHSSFSPGERMAKTRMEGTAIAAQAFLDGTKKQLLLVNKRNRDAAADLPQVFEGGQARCVDTATGAGAPSSNAIGKGPLLLHPFAVCVATSRESQ